MWQDARVLPNSGTPLQVSSVLRWPGSKRALLPILTQLVPRDYKTYVEPFTGSGALFFALCPPQAILGDFNGELINAWSHVRDNPVLLREAVAEIPVDRTTYYSIRGEVPESDFARAVKFVYLNRNCFNGVYRTNRQGQFNVPMGRSTGALPGLDAFKRCAAALESATLLEGDFLETVERATAGDFVYVDPPYSATRANHGEYGYGTFSEEKDGPRVRELLESISEKGVMVLVSYGSDSILPDGRAWNTREIQSRRSIAATAIGRARVSKEILAWNYKQSNIERP